MERHGGELAIAAASAHGIDTLFTLSGAHIFPLYDAASRAVPAVRIVDVRHEQTAVFAAEGLARLTRRPGLAAVTAGPGVTNTVSAVTTAWFNGVPLLLLGGRAPAYRWGSGALQELDHPPLLAPVTKHSATIAATADVASRVDEALRLASLPPRGPVFLDIPMDVLFEAANGEPAAPVDSHGHVEPDAEALASVAALVAKAARPLVVLGGDVWLDGAEAEARQFVEALGLPTITNGMGRGILPGKHPLLVTRARSAAVKNADLVVVVGTPLDFRMGYGSFGSRTSPAQVVHITDSPARLANHVPLAAAVSGSLSAVFDVLTAAGRSTPGSQSADWLIGLQETARAAREADLAVLTSAATPIHPARVYGELVPRLADDAVVIGDGGDFVSFAGRFVEPSRPGHWLDPGPFGCLGTGLGYAVAARIARPDAQVVLLLGDGAAGFSLMDVDSLVRHRLPAVMIMGNNSSWGLELHPMRLLYGNDIAATLRPGTRYDEVVRALGGAGETVSDPEQIGPALDRAFASDVPYLVNIVTDPEVAYPRRTTGL